MPRNGSGVYTLPAGNPVVDGTLITTAWANPTLSDIASQLNNVVTRDGLLGFTSPALFVDGSLALPAISFVAQPSTGFYRTALALSVSYAGGLSGFFNGDGFNGRVGGTTPAAGTFTELNADTPVTQLNSTRVPTTSYLTTFYAPLNNAALTGIPTAPTAAPGTATDQLATMNALLAQAFSTALPSQAGNAGKFVTTNGVTASWASVGLTVVPVSGTTHNAAVGTNVVLNNVLDTAVTAPTVFVAGNQLTVSPNNGQDGNTLDVGAKTVIGYRGVTATGVIPLNKVRPIELVAIDTNTWMML